MTQEEYKLLIDCTAEAVRRLKSRGVPHDKAVEIATEMAVLAVKKKYPGGLGGIPVTPTPLDTLAQESAAAAAVPIIKNIREAVSPWLWVTSLIGFGMGLLNSRRIAKMYGDWRKKKGARA
jgi:hypothetical protein